VPLSPLFTRQPKARACLVMELELRQTQHCRREAQ
jgi:hypothetical protein